MVNMIWVWLVLIVVFGIAEAVTSALVSIWFAAGALAALLAAMMNLSLLVQIVVFLAVSALTLALTRPLMKKYITSSLVPTNADRILGQTVRVTETIQNEHAAGAVYADGKVWSARSVDDAVIPAGATVRVERLEGVKLVVKSCEKKEDTP